MIALPPFALRPYLTTLGGIIVIALLPVISVLLAAFGAYLGDCDLNEGFVQPCVVVGVDLGGLLYGLGVMGWLGLVTLPLGALGALAVVAVAGLHFILDRLRANRSK